MKKRAAAPLPVTGPVMPGPLCFRAVLTAVTVVILLLGIGQWRLLGVVEPLFFGAILFVSRLFPVVLSREKPVSFTAACVFAAALELNGMAAGGLVLLACVLHGRYFLPGGRAYAAYLGAQYALAALTAHAFFVRFTPEHILLLTPNGRTLFIAALTALVFIATNILLIIFGNLGTRYAQREYTLAIFRSYVTSYGVSFPLALAALFTYHTLGIAALPILCALVFVGANGVRAAIENRLLKAQLWAVEALGRSCATGVDSERPLQRFLELAHHLVLFDRAVFWMEDASRTGVAARLSFPEEAPGTTDVREAQRLIERVMLRSTPLLLSDSGRGSGAAQEVSPGESWILYPLLHQGRAIGVAQFIRSSRRPFSRQDMARLSPLIPQTAVAFESVRVRHLKCRYEDMATTDGLTGLLNHRYSQEALRHEMHRAARYHKSVSVLMMDVDFFKQFNDSYGHPQGDVLLQGIARILRQSVRVTDHVGRYGGEEFIIVLPETGRYDACLLAERIRLAVESTPFPDGKGDFVHRTLSIGVATFPQDATQPNTLVQSADAALYRAKREGKNRVLTTV